MHGRPARTAKAQTYPTRIVRGGPAQSELRQPDESSCSLPYGGRRGACSISATADAHHAFIHEAVRYLLAVVSLARMQEIGHHASASNEMTLREALCGNERLPIECPATFMTD